MPLREGGRGARATFVKLAALIVILLAAVLAARQLGYFRVRDPSALAEAVRALRERPFIAPLFVAAYALATTVALPGSLLTIAGGAIFGFKLGVVLNWLGASIGATAAYLLARTLGLDAVQRVLGARAARLGALTGAHGFSAVLRLRLVPLVPFNVLNFAAGLAGVRFRDYLPATLMGLVPGTIVYTYFADALLAGAAGAKREALVRLASAGVLLVALSFVPALARRLGWAERASPLP